MPLYDARNRPVVNGKPIEDSIEELRKMTSKCIEQIKYDVMQIDRVTMFTLETAIVLEFLSKKLTEIIPEFSLDQEELSEFRKTRIEEYIQRGENAPTQEEAMSAAIANATNINLKED